MRLLAITNPAIEFLAIADYTKIFFLSIPPGCGCNEQHPTLWRGKFCPPRGRSSATVALEERLVSSFRGLSMNLNIIPPLLQTYKMPTLSRSAPPQKFSLVLPPSTRDPIQNMGALHPVSPELYAWKPTRYALCFLPCKLQDIQSRCTPIAMSF